MLQTCFLYPRQVNGKVGCVTVKTVPLLFIFALNRVSHSSTMSNSLQDWVQTPETTQLETKVAAQETRHKAAEAAVVVWLDQLKQVNWESMVRELTRQRVFEIPLFYYDNWLRVAPHKHDMEINPRVPVEYQYLTLDLLMPRLKEISGFEWSWHHSCVNDKTDVCVLAFLPLMTQLQLHRRHPEMPVKQYNQLVLSLGWPIDFQHVSYRSLTRLVPAESSASPCCVLV